MVGVEVTTKVSGEVHIRCGELVEPGPATLVKIKEFQIWWSKGWADDNMIKE